MRVCSSYELLWRSTKEVGVQIDQVADTYIQEALHGGFKLHMTPCTTLFDISMKIGALIWLENTPKSLLLGFPHCQAKANTTRNLKQKSETRRLQKKWEEIAAN